MGSSSRKKKGAQPQPSSDHQKWEIIFKALKQMLQKQAHQLDSLLQERNLLQQRIQLQCHRWNSDVRLLEDIISQKQGQLRSSELGKLFEIKKADMLLGSKQRDALITKLKLEHACNELDDFKAWFDILSHKCPDREDISPNRVYENLKAKGGRHSSSKEDCKHHPKLEKQVALLKNEYEKLSLKCKSEIAALQDENNFVWNQYREMEGSYTNQLNTKNSEIDQANEKITNLLKNIEQLQSASMEMDEKVETLRANNTELMAEVNIKDGRISKLSKEIELLKSKRNDDVPLSNDCSPELPSSSLKGRKNIRNKVSAVLAKDTTSAQQQATISTLREKVSELESEGNQKSEEICRLSKELKLLGSKTSADSPVLKRCINEPPSSRLRSRNYRRNGGAASVEEEASVVQLEATIATLKVKNNELEAQANQKNMEISALSEELKLLKSKTAADTPVLRHCTSRPSSSGLRGKKDGKDRDSSAVKEKTSTTQLVSEQGGRRSKRKQDDIHNSEYTPRLFTSQFKIPKLRSQSPRET